MEEGDAADRNWRAFWRGDGELSDILLRIVAPFHLLGIDAPVVETLRIAAPVNQNSRAFRRHVGNLNVDQGGECCSSGNGEPFGVTWENQK